MQLQTKHTKKLTDIEVKDGIVVVKTKEYYKNTDSLVSNCKIEWNLTYLKSKIRSNDNVEVY